ncbi:MAG: hypothetical protein JO256_10135 [Alphaproteobacteria bacterium]|nr:hypothetical protein [Alphaproteobacteria bacterium]
MTPDANEAETTETLLRGLIAECGAMIRDQLRPAMDAHDDAKDKSYVVADAVRLMKAGGGLDEAIARLRGHPAPEQRQRITVERVIAAPPARPLLTGEGVGG